MENKKTLRRVKRQDKRFNNQLVRRTIKKLFGDATTSTVWHFPSKSDTNHRRVIGQRLQSGRIE